jgi:hypothetical protein
VSLEEFGKYWGELPPHLKVEKVKDAAVVQKKALIESGMKIGGKPLKLKDCSHLMYLDFELKVKIELIVQRGDKIIVVDAVGEKTSLVEGQILFGFKEGDATPREVVQ